MKSLLFIWLVGFFLAGCCATDCISRAQMPYTIYSDGIKYHLTDHLSIRQLISSANMQYDSRKSWISTMRRKFPNDQELLIYLNGVEERAKGYAGHIQILEDIKKDLEKSRSELYYYKVIGKKRSMSDGEIGVEVKEEGWLILSNRKVFNKYVVGSDGVQSESMLRGEGLLPDP